MREAVVPEFFTQNGPPKPDFEQETDLPDEIAFLLDGSAIRVTKTGSGTFVAEKLNTDQRVTITPAVNDVGMLFDDKFVYTESFMAIVGMCDAVNETPAKVAVFVGDADMYT
jgi:hypothetical protein